MICHKGNVSAYCRFVVVEEDYCVFMVIFVKNSYWYGSTVPFTFGSAGVYNGATCNEC